jgi:hypothetical protein
MVFRPTARSSFIHLLQQALVIPLIGHILRVEHVGRAAFLQSSALLAFGLQCNAEGEVRRVIIGI